ncbi:MAG: hypothetical protein ACYDDF_10200 [Thermoplasmatota archaeon]
MKVLAFVNLTLDGVMQGPARLQEDPRNEFDQGGWGAPYQAMTEAGEAMANAGAMLFGRWTYETFHEVWGRHPESQFSAFSRTFQNMSRH